MLAPDDMCLMTIVLLYSVVVRSKSCCECTAEACDEVGCMASVRVDKVALLRAEILGRYFLW